MFNLLARLGSYSYFWLRTPEAFFCCYAIFCTAVRSRLGRGWSICLRSFTFFSFEFYFIVYQVDCRLLYDLLVDTLNSLPYKLGCWSCREFLWFYSYALPFAWSFLFGNFSVSIFFYSLRALLLVSLYIPNWTYDFELPNRSGPSLGCCVYSSFSTNPKFLDLSLLEVFKLD